MIFAICSAAVILALTIIAMASCIKVASDEFNWMEQKYYDRLKEKENENVRMCKRN